MIRQTLLALALAVGVAVAPAAEARFGSHRMELCSISSDYNLRIGTDSITFSRAGSEPRTVVMRDGTLLVDGREIALRADDRARIAKYERTVRTLVPEAKAIAFDALEIAFGAVEAVLRTFVESAEAERVVERLSAARVRAIERIEHGFDNEPWNEKEFERLIEDTVTEVVPEIAAVAAAAAIRIAFSGDENAAADIEARAKRLEQTIEEEVEKRARELEKRAEALCPMVQELDALEAKLAVRIEDRVLDLVTHD